MRPARVRNAPRSYRPAVPRNSPSHRRPPGPHRPGGLPKRAVDRLCLPRRTNFTCVSGAHGPSVCRARSRTSVNRFLAGAPCSCHARTVILATRSVRSVAADRTLCGRTSGSSRARAQCSASSSATETRPARFLHGEVTPMNVLTHKVLAPSNRASQIPDREIHSSLPK